MGWNVSITKYAAKEELIIAKAIAMEAIIAKVYFMAAFDFPKETIAVG